MNFEYNAPKWDAEGTEPSAELQKSGFVAGYKPPAAYFNYLFHMYTLCINELQGKMQAYTIGESDDLDNYVNVGTYTFSLAASSTITNIPEETQGVLLVLPRLVKNNPNNVVQVIITQSNKIYVRNRTDAVWNSWRMMFKDDDVIPIKNGGTGAKSVTDMRTAFNLPETCVLTEDWNTATNTGWYMSNGENKNAPSGSWYFGLVIAHNDQYVLQEVYAFTNSGNKATDLTKYIRSCYAGTWTEWANVTVQRTVPEDAKLDFIKSITSDVQTQLNNLYNNKMNLKPTFIELTPAEGTNNGGYIDFHYGGSEEDYTARIIEEQAGVLLARAILKVEGDLYENGSNRVYSTGNKPTASDVGAVSKTGDTMNGDLALQRVSDNGKALLLKNHSETADYGTMLRDYDKDGNMLVLVINALTQILSVVDKSGNAYEIYHAGNKPTPAEIGAAVADHTHNTVANATNADTVDGYHVQTTVGNAGLKPIYATTVDLTAGTSALATGTICLIYE